MQLSGSWTSLKDYIIKFSKENHQQPLIRNKIICAKRILKLIKNRRL